MKNVKILSFAAIVAAALLAFAGTASATILTNGTGGTYGVGTVIHASAESTVTLHPPIGDITCTTSTVEGKVTNAGSASTTVSGPISSLTFGGCNATVTVLKPGSLEIHTKTANADGNGTITFSGMEITAVFSGLHCIFKTDATDVGTITGSKSGSGTIHLNGTVQQVGGVFCGPSAEWTGSYKVDKPTPLYID